MTQLFLRSTGRPRTTEAFELALRPGLSGSSGRSFSRAFWSGKKSRLSGGILRIAKVRETHADQTKSLLRAKADTLAQCQRNVRQFLAGSRRSRGCMAASENLELAGFQLQHHGPSHSRFVAGGGPGLLRKSSDHRFQLGQQDIPRKRVFGGYRLCGPVRDHLAVVYAARQLEQPHAMAAEAAFKSRYIHSTQVGDRLHLKLLQFCFPNRADSRQSTDRHR